MMNEHVEKLKDTLRSIPMLIPCVKLVYKDEEEKYSVYTYEHLGSSARVSINVYHGNTYVAWCLSSYQYTSEGDDIGNDLPIDEHSADKAFILVDILFS